MASRIVPVTDEDNQGQAVPELVRTGGGLGGIGAGHLVQQPVRGRAKALLVLLTADTFGLVMEFFKMRNFRQLWETTSRARQERRVEIIICE